MKSVHLFLVALCALTTGGCTDSSGDQSGLDAPSRSTGEPNQRLGNDPAQQNTGQGSNPENESPRQDVPLREDQAPRDRPQQ